MNNLRHDKRSLAKERYLAWGQRRDLSLPLFSWSGRAHEDYREFVPKKLKTSMQEKSDRPATGIIHDKRRDTTRLDLRCDLIEQSHKARLNYRDYFGGMGSGGMRGDSTHARGYQSPYRYSKIEA